VTRENHEDAREGSYVLISEVDLTKKNLEKKREVDSMMPS